MGSYGIKNRRKWPWKLVLYDLGSPSVRMKISDDGNWCQEHLADQKLWLLLEKVDAELAQATRRQGCPHCGANLRRADYDRKPRGGPGWSRRESFCCGKDGCRRRQTPPSVRFFGRRIYPGFVIVLVSAMTHGLKPARIRMIQERLGIDRRTLERWRQWWLRSFVHGAFWKAARAQFMPPLHQQMLPWSLVERFGIERPEGLIRLLRFLAPSAAGSTIVCEGQLRARRGCR